MAIAREAEPVGSLSEVKEAGLDREDLLTIYRNMLITRGIEERGHILYKQGKIPGSFYTGRGNEAASVGVATAMGSDDVGTPLHRDMGVHVTRGVEPWKIFAQYMGRADGPTKGRDGNVHMADSRLGLLAMVSHLPAMLPVAVGCALAFRIREEKRVAVGWFGEGASARGDEPRRRQKASGRVRLRQQPVGVLDADVPRVRDRARCRPRRRLRLRGRGRRRQRRAGRLPRGQASDREGARRRRPDAARVPDPPHGGPRRARRRLLRPQGHVRALGRERPDRAVPQLAARARRPRRRAGGRDLGRREEAAERRAPARGGVAPAGGLVAQGRRLRNSRGPRHTAPQVVAEKTYLQAISDGLRQEMRRDKRVFVIGEDVGVYGGAFKVTLGFQAEFGPWRVIDTPLSETAIVGGATGSALMGLRPVAEMQFADFIACAWDHLVTVAAKQHFRGRTPVPLVVRLPSGGGFSGGPFHSQNPESSFAHIPGLKIVCPSTPHDAKGLLASAIEEPNPVLYFEHKHLYRRIKGDVPEERYTVPFGHARVHRPGDDATIVTWGAMVHTASEAADELAKEGFEAEVVDLRTLVPWDKDRVLEGVQRCSKVLVLHEDTRTAGFGAEIAATIAEEAFEHLDAPIVRIAAPDTPVPFAPPLEKAFIPQVEDVVTALRELAAY